MNNTNTIFKSLLIMIVAISLFTVSCSKDEGGTKTPTNPTIVKVSADQITGVLKGLGQLKDTDQPQTVILDLSNIEPKDGKATIGGANQSFGKVKTALGNVASTPQNILEVTDNLSTITTKPGTGKETLSVDLTFKAKSGFEFDTTITSPDASAKKYNYDATTKEAKLTLEITPANNWAD